MPSSPDIPAPSLAYAELQVTSNFSFLRGASHPQELAIAASALGLSAFALTDRNSLAGVVRAHVAAKETGIPFIVGCRLDFRCGRSLLAYPIDRAAYGRLSRLITLGRRRAPKGECHLDLADLESHGEGLILIVLPEEAAAQGEGLPRRRVLATRQGLGNRSRRGPGRAGSFPSALGIPPTVSAPSVSRSAADPLAARQVVSQMFQKGG